MLTCASFVAILFLTPLSFLFSTFPFFRDSNLENNWYLVLESQVMATTPESVAQQNAKIAEVLQRVSKASDIFTDVASKNAGLTGLEVSGAVSEAKTTLVMETQKLLSTVRGPLDSVFVHFENVGYRCLDTAIVN